MGLSVGELITVVVVFGAAAIAVGFVIKQLLTRRSSNS